MTRRILAGIVAAIAVYFAVFGGEYSVFELWRLDARHAEEAAALDRARDEVARLEARIDTIDGSTTALERLAREEYGMIRDGERLYRFAEEPANAASAAGERSHE